MTGNSDGNTVINDVNPSSKLAQDFEVLPAISKINAKLYERNCSNFED